MAVLDAEWDSQLRCISQVGPAGFWWESPGIFSTSSRSWDGSACLGTCFFAEQIMGSGPAFTTGFVPTSSRINSPPLPLPSSGEQEKLRHFLQ